MKRRAFDTSPSNSSIAGNNVKDSRRKISIVTCLKRIENPLLNFSPNADSNPTLPEKVDGEKTINAISQQVPLFPESIISASDFPETEKVTLPEQRAIPGSILGISSVLIKTKRKLLESGECTTPDGWNQQIEYEAKWDLDPFHGDEDEVDPNDYNNEVDDLEDIAWMLSGINHVKVAVYESKVLELMFLSWKPEWVPLHLVSFDFLKLKTQLKVLKTKYAKLNEDAKINLKKDIPHHIKRSLALYRLSDGSKFLIKQVIKFAVVKMPGQRGLLEVVKVDFRHTYEHCSALFRNEKAYESLYRRRIEGAKAFLKVNDDLNSVEIMQNFVTRSETELRKLLASV